MHTTTRDDAPSRHQDLAGCPTWCDPSEHLFDCNDTALIVIHRSKAVVVAGFGSTRVQQSVRRFGARLVRSPISIGIEGNGRIELQRRDEATECLKEITRTLVTLTNRTWPAHNSTLAC